MTICATPGNAYWYYSVYSSLCGMSHPNSYNIKGAQVSAVVAFEIHFGMVTELGGGGEGGRNGVIYVSASFLF